MGTSFSIMTCLLPDMLPRPCNVANREVYGEAFSSFFLSPLLLPLRASRVVYFFVVLTPPVSADRERALVATHSKFHKARRAQPCLCHHVRYVLL
jgi:hypothetical protein